MKNYACLAWLMTLATLVAAPSSAPSSTPPNPLDLLLIRACEDGNSNEMAVFISEGASITATNDQGSTALMKATEGSHSDIVRKLLAAKAPVNTANQYGETALNLASWQGDVDSVRQLCEAGADPNTMSKNGSTPLMGAASRGKTEIAEVLLQAGSKVNTVSGKGTALTYAALSQKTDLLKLLLDHGADPNIVPERASYEDCVLTALEYAARKGDLAATDLLLAHGAQVDLAQFGFTPLMAAAQCNYVDVMKRLKDHGAQIDQDGQGYSALIQAARCGSDDAAKLLVDWNAKLNLQDQQGRTALIYALQEGREEIAIMLCRKGADVNIKDSRGETALAYAFNRELVNAVAVLQEKGADPVEPHLIPLPAPAEPLSPAQTWGLGLAAMYLQFDGNNLDCLIDNQSPASDNSRLTLKDFWSVTDHDSLLAELHDLATSGYRQQFLAEGKVASEMDDNEFQDYLAKYPQKEAQIREARASYEKWKDRSGLAFDLCRYVNVADNGYSAGYLTKQEVWDLILPMAKKAQESFASWQELSDNFLDGRAIWNSGSDPQFTAMAKLLLDPHESNSPWNHNPWTTDLGVTVDTDDQVDD